MRTPLLVLADDLTGAADAGVAFTASHPEVVLDLSPMPVMAEHGQPGVMVYSTETRDVDGSYMAQRLAAALKAIPPGRILFKKVDSVFRGNTFAEIGEVLGQTAYDLAVIAPAYPQNGRRIVDGILRIDDAKDGLDLMDGLSRVGVRPTWIPALSSADALNLRPNVDKVVLCDAFEPLHLEELVRAVQSTGGRVLWIGSGGLAHALAGSMRTGSRVALRYRRGQVIYFIGSNHPVTTRQTSRLLSAEHSADAMVVEVRRGVSTASEIRDAISSVDESKIGALFMTGGDTARAVCEALGISQLRLLREFAPGVPVALAVGGAYDGIPVILKSGGFGTTDLLCRIHSEFS